MKYRIYNYRVCCQIDNNIKLSGTQFLLYVGITPLVDDMNAYFSLLHEIITPNCNNVRHAEIITHTIFEKYVKIKITMFFHIPMNIISVFR